MSHIPLGVPLTHGVLVGTLDLQAVKDTFNGVVQQIDEALLTASAGVMDGCSIRGDEMSIEVKLPDIVDVGSTVSQNDAKVILATELIHYYETQRNFHRVDYSRRRNVIRVSWIHSVEAAEKQRARLDLLSRRSYD